MNDIATQILVKLILLVTWPLMAILLLGIAIGLALCAWVAIPFATVLKKPEGGVKLRFWWEG